MSCNFCRNYNQNVVTKAISPFYYNIRAKRPQPPLSVLASAPQKANISSHFHPFSGHMGADVGFLKAVCDFRQQISPKALSVSVPGRQKANIELIYAWRAVSAAARGWSRVAQSALRRAVGRAARGQRCCVSSIASLPVRCSTATATITACGASFFMTSSKRFSAGRQYFSASSLKAWRRSASSSTM